MQTQPGDTGILGTQIQAMHAQAIQHGHVRHISGGPGVAGQVGECSIWGAHGIIAQGGVGLVQLVHDSFFAKE